MRNNNELIPLGEYEGEPISQRADGMIDATAMCKVMGKQWHDYFRAKETQQFLQVLSNETGIPVSLLWEKHNKGRAGGVRIFAHEDVAIDLARWGDKPFHVWMIQVTKQRLRHGNTMREIGHQVAEGIREGLQPVRSEITEMRQDLGGVKQDVSDVKKAVTELQEDSRAKRQPFSKGCQKACTYVVREYFNNKCPRCQKWPVKAIHHWRNKGGNMPQIAFPVCDQCHDDLTRDYNKHDEWDHFFQSFQSRAKEHFIAVGVIKNPSTLIATDHDQRRLPGM